MNNLIKYLFSKIVGVKLSAIKYPLRSDKSGVFHSLDSFCKHVCVPSLLFSSSTYLKSLMVSGYHIYIHTPVTPHHSAANQTIIIIAKIVYYI